MILLQVDTIYYLWFHFTGSPFFSRSCDPFTILTHAHYILTTWNFLMESLGTVKVENVCEYKALKECLEKNNWKKDKCEKEWTDFQTLCKTNRR